MLRLVLYFAILLPPGMPLSIADWMWGLKDKPEFQTSDREVRQGVSFPEVPFETATSDERFLQEAQYFGLAPSSQLDACQQGVVLRLKSSCSSLTEEQLAKFSVALLNCQSGAEGRPQYPCSEEMTLRQCTGDMDPDTWNTYHLMNNRARAVCIAARQAQFRALTEMTVNKLMNTAKGQIDALESLQAGQEKLSSITEDTMQKVSSGQETLIERQEWLKNSQQQAHSFVSHSLRELAREKSLIASGHRELARMVSVITGKLDMAEKEINEQNDDRKNQHKELLKDLKKLQQQASKIWTEIDTSTQEILLRHEKAVLQYETTLESLKAINASVIYLQNLMVTTQTEVDKRLGWIVEILGGAGDRLDKVTAFVVHLGFLLSSMLIIAFIGAPKSTKVLLLLFVCLNMTQIVMENAEAAIPLPATTFLIVAGTLLHQFIQSLHHFLKKPTPAGAITAPEHMQRAPAPVKNNLFERVSTKSKELWSKVLTLTGLTGNKVKLESSNRLNSNEDEADSSESDSGLEEPANLPRFAANRLRNDLLPERGSPALRRSRSNTPSRSGTPRPPCNAICLNGQPCRLYAITAGGFCSRHSS